jgi:hypothetical protein
MPPLETMERSFIMRSWEAVQDSVHYRMASYPGNDVARFEVDELARSIRRSIASRSVEDKSQLFGF